MTEFRLTKFWQFSSRNRSGGMPEITRARRNLMLELWAAGHTQDHIAEILDIDIRTLTRCLARARRDGDARAVVRHPATRRAMEMMK